MSNTSECSSEVTARENRPIHSLDRSTFREICRKKIETGWRIVDSNGKISIDFKSSTVRDTGYYMYRLFHDYN